MHRLYSVALSVHCSEDADRTWSYHLQSKSDETGNCIYRTRGLCQCNQWASLSNFSGSKCFLGYSWMFIHISRRYTQEGLHVNRHSCVTWKRVIIHYSVQHYWGKTTIDYADDHRRSKWKLYDWIYYFVSGSDCKVLWCVRLCVYVSVCLLVCEDISGTTCRIYPIFLCWAVRNDWFRLNLLFITKLDRIHFPMIKSHNFLTNYFEITRKLR